MKISLATFLPLAVLLAACEMAPPPTHNDQAIDSKLAQAQAAAALNTATSATLYSLEPEKRPGFLDSTLYHFVILGSITLNSEQTAAATAVFRSAIADYQGQPPANCFDPRQALRIKSNGHVFDYLICFQCRGLSVWMDGKSIAGFPIVGSSKILNGFLAEAGIPQAKVSQPDESNAPDPETIAAAARWVSATPKSIQPLWNNPWGIAPPWSPIDLQSAQKALAEEYPDAIQQILVLFAWYGSNTGSLQHSQLYDDVPKELLLNYSTPDLVSALQSTALTDQQLEGAALLFSNYEFSQQRPNDLKALPTALKQQLLQHWANSDEDVRRVEAKDLFGQ